MTTTATAKSKIPLAEARDLAASLVTQLLPMCQRVVAAGSIRRGKDFVGDIELVAIPEYREQPDMFGGAPERISLVEPLAIEGVDHLTKNGERYKQFSYRGRQVDLFLTDPDRWGLILAIRTGPREFSQHLMLRAREMEMFVDKGALWRGSQQVPVPEERDLFRLLKLNYVAPKERR